MASLPLLAATTFLALYISRTVYGELVNYVAARSRGCQSAGWSYDFGGLRRFWDLVLIMKEKQLPRYGERLHARHGRYTLPISDLGRPGFFTSDPRVIQAILATNFKDWGLGRVRHAFVRFLGEGLFTQDGEAWHRSRSLLRPSFTRTQIADFNDLEVHTQELFETIAAVANKDGDIDMKILFNDLTMDFAAEFLLGESAGCLEQRKNGCADDGITHWFETGMLHTALSWNFGTLHWMWFPPQFRKACDYVHTYVDRYVHRVLRSTNASEKTTTGSENTELGTSKTISEAPKQQRYVFLEAVAAVVQDEYVLRSQILNVLLVGRDTTASLMSWLVWVLAREPAVFAALQAEVHRTFGKDYKTAKLPTWQELKDMNYLQAVISETLRLHPSAPYSNRTALCNTVLPVGGGKDENAPLYVPKGYCVTWSISCMHRRKDFWGEDADDFKPERWLQADTGKCMREIGWGYFPFNGGPRICPGQQFALTESSYVLVRLLQRFSAFEKTPGVSDVPTYEPSLVAPPGDGVWVRLKE